MGRSLWAEPTNLFILLSVYFSFFSLIKNTIVESSEVPLIITRTFVLVLPHDLREANLMLQIMEQMEVRLWSKTGLLLDAVRKLCESFKCWWSMIACSLPKDVTHLAWPTIWLVATFLVYTDKLMYRLNTVVISCYFYILFQNCSLGGWGILRRRIYTASWEIHLKNWINIVLMVQMTQILY